MSVIDFPDGYYSKYSNLKEWVFVAFNPRKAIQSAELNDLQRILANQAQVSFSHLFQEGQIANGVQLSQIQLDPSGYTINITAGVLYANGYWHNVAADSINITGIGIETIGLKLDLVPVTSEQDSDLLDPASGSEAYGVSSADRLVFSTDYVLDDPNSIPIAVYENGQLVSPPTLSNGIIDQILEILAQRTREIDGSFLAVRPSISIEDPTSPSENIWVNIDNGIGYLNGRRRTNSHVRAGLKRPIAGQLGAPEGISYLSANKVYDLQRWPVSGITSISAYIQSPSFDMLRGGSLNGSDSILLEYQPTFSIVSVSQAPHGTYTPGTDYDLIAGTVKWKSGGEQPVGGSTYQVVVLYTKNLTKAIRTQTSVIDEAKTIAAGTYTLSHTDIASVSVVRKADHSVTYVEGVDYTVDYAAGVVTHTTPADGTAMHVSYQYWSHTVEGDFVSRDSFITASGNLLIDSTPTKTPTGVTVDFRKQISFDTVVSGPVVHPANSTNITVSYSFALPRRDILAWREDGIFEILEGTPSLRPSLPALSDKHTPICKFDLPAEARAADVTKELYDNVTLKRTELRDMSRTLDSVLYNLSNFQLDSELAGLPSPTAKIGIYADPLENFDLMDRGDSDHAGTLDVLNRSFKLPRSIEQKTPIFSSTTATLKDGKWVPPYTEQTIIQQAFASVARVINKYDSINTRAKVVISSTYNSKLLPELLSVTTVNSAFNIQTGHVSAPVSISDIENNYLILQLANKIPLANSIGIGAVADVTPWYESKVQTPTGWTESFTNSQGSNPLSTASVVNSSTSVLENRWATITRNTKILIAGDTPSGGTITASGSVFGPNERHITCVMNDSPVTLTSVNPLYQDDSPLHPSAIKADSTGSFEATFTVPAGVRVGENTLEFFGHDPDDDTRIQSYTTCSYVATPNMEYVDLTISPKDQGQFLFGYIATYGSLATTIGIPDFVAGDYVPYVIARWFKYSAAHTLALVLKMAIDLGISVSLETFENTIAASILYNSLQSILTGTQITAIAAAVNLASTDIEANEQAMIAACPFLSISFWDYIYTEQIDPLAQTFQVSENRFVNSLELYFNVPPVSKPVGVAICEAQNGVPSSLYMAQSWKAANTITGSNTAAVATKFTFDSPVRLEAAKDYAFVVLTEDSAASIWTSVLGQKDVNNVLITKNPAAGVCLESADAKSWQAIPSTDLKFKLNACNFTADEVIVTTGPQIFSGNIGQVMFVAPFKEFSNATEISFQYSTDNVYWNELSPAVDAALANQIIAGNSIFFRVKMISTEKECPLLINSPQIHGYLYATSGAYITRTSDLGSSVARYFDVYMDTITPGGTTITPKLKLDAGAYVAMTEDVAFAQELDADLGLFLRKYTYDAGVGITKQLVKLKVEMTTANRHITPIIRKPRQVAR